MSEGCICRATERAWLSDGDCATCGRAVLEKQLAPVVLKILCGNTGLTLWRNPAGYDTARKVRYGLAPGSGDYIGLWTPGGARYVEVELKTPKGRLSPEQVARKQLVARLGGIYAVTRSIADAEALLAQLRAGAHQ